MCHFYINYFVLYAKNAVGKVLHLVHYRMMMSCQVMLHTKHESDHLTAVS